MITQLVKGLATYIPGVYRCFSRKPTGGTESARYCYSAWLRHLVSARDNGLPTHPETVAELGPGDSFGIGLAALLSGAKMYYAFDVVRYSTAERNIAVFDELKDLFTHRRDIPGDDEFPEVKPHLDSCTFPGDILTDARLDAALTAERLNLIRDSILTPDSAGSVVRYQVPWDDSSVLEAGTVDMVFSQAVLEHVEHPSMAYEKMYAWLRPGGFVSHSIDFRSHGTAGEWNGHWRYSDLVWKLIAGRRPYLINRLPHSSHIALMEEKGFAIRCDEVTRSPSKLGPEDLASRFAHMSRDDLVTSSAFVQASR